MKHCIYLIIAIVFFSSCNNKQSKLYHNEDIKEAERASINVEVKLAIDAITNKDANSLRSLCSSSLTETEKVMIDSLSTHVELSHDVDIHVLEQYLLFNPGEKKPDQVTTDNLGENDFNLKFNVIGEYTYVYVARLAERNSNLKHLFTCTFDKHNGKWEITGLYIGLYKYNDLTAPELYAKIKRDANKENQFFNLLATQVCLILAAPGGPAMHYKSEKEIFKFKDSLVKQIQNLHEVPKYVTDVKTAPEILDLYPQLIKRHFYPFIIYKSSISLNNKTDLTTENESLNSILNKELPGISQFADTILYRVVNKDINSTGKIDYYGFVKKVIRH